MKIRPNKTIASLLGAAFIRLFGATWKMRYKGIENLDEARRRSPGIIFTFWHGRMLVLAWAHRNSNAYILASENYDGDLMGKITERLGFGHLKGSTSRGGARALRQLRAVLEEGSDVGLSVDGPRGPRGNVQQGAVELARMTGCAILPVTSSASGARLMGSWDRFQLPGPFTRVTVAYGRPIIVSCEAGLEEREDIRTGLQDELNRLTTELDLEWGHSGPGVWPHEDS